MTSKPKISLLVTDLDNTLYDWVTYFSTSLYRMVATAATLLKVPEAEILDDLRSVHQKYHDSEHPFALLETACVQRVLPGSSRRELKSNLQAAFDAFNAARDNTLRLYPGVQETLRHLKTLGLPIVGHTEASVPNALYRLLKLECITSFAKIFAIEHAGEAHPEPEKTEKYDPYRRMVRILSQQQRKPNPTVLLEICDAFGVPPSHTLYVGDSVARDIGMAREAGVWSAYAEYGTHFKKEHWLNLVRITHWTEADIRHNEDARLRYGSTKADVVLHDGFPQLLDMFRFEP